MQPKRALVVAFLCTLAGLGATLATTLEEEFILKTGWMTEGYPPAGSNIQMQHYSWHNKDFGLGARGRNFLEYHRELLAQSDDFRIYGCDNGCGLVVDGDGDPDAAIIPVLPLKNYPLKFAHPSDPVVFICRRPPMQAIDLPSPPSTCHPASFWTGRPANLQLIVSPAPVDDLYDYPTIDALGVAIIRDFHNQGHGAVGRYLPSDMIPVLSSVKDGAFYQWHKNIDNIYADWAVAKYRRSDNLGLPIFFSVAVTPPNYGVEGSALRDRSGSSAYEGRSGTALVPATQYGAIPRIPSDIYVGDNNGSNLLYAAGTRKWGGAATEGWDIDAWTILNHVKQGTNGWYFSVTSGSMGVDPSPVFSETSKGGDVFESTNNLTSNLLVRSEASLGLASTDDLDALEIDQQRQVQGTNDTQAAGFYDRPKQWFSLRAGTIYSVQAKDKTGQIYTVSPNDILRFDANGDLVIDVRGETLGLDSDGIPPDGDDLDALAIVDADGDPVNANKLDGSDKIYYSLLKGSKSLAAGVDSGADIFCKTVQGLPCGRNVTDPKVELRAVSLGLQMGDDIDALDIRRGPPGVAGVAAPSGLSGASRQTASSILFDPNDPGACCHANGTCTEVLNTACVSPGDSFAGPDTVCAATQCASAPGACCTPTGSCTVVSDHACADLAGTFRGAGTTCPPVPSCPVPPSNDECANAFVIPYNFVSPFEPPLDKTDNTNATIPVYFRSPVQDDPPYSCNDHDIFSGPYGSGTIWFSYTVPVGSGAGPGPGPDMPVARRSIVLSTSRAAQFYPYGDGAGDTRMAMYFAPNGDCSVLQEVACADNIAGDPSAQAAYAPLRYDNPMPGKYYIQVSTTFNVDRGRTYLTVTDPAGPTATYTSQPRVPAVTTWGLVFMTLVLLGAGAALLRLR